MRMFHPKRIEEEERYPEEIEGMLDILEEMDNESKNRDKREII
jgi:hypothetical protein